MRYSKVTLYVVGNFYKKPFEYPMSVTVSYCQLLTSFLNISSPLPCTNCSLNFTETKDYESEDYYDSDESDGEIPHIRNFLSDDSDSDLSVNSDHDQFSSFMKGRKSQLNNQAGDREIDGIHRGRPSSFMGSDKVRLNSLLKKASSQLPDEAGDSEEDSIYRRQSSGFVDSDEVRFTNSLKKSNKVLGNDIDSHESRWKRAAALIDDDDDPQRTVSFADQSFSRGRNTGNGMSEETWEKI